MKRNEPQTLGQIIQRMAEQNANFARGMQVGRIEEIWTQLVGEGVASMTRQIDIKGVIMTVYIDSAVARREVFIRRGELIRSINHLMGMLIIRDLIVK